MTSVVDTFTVSNFTGVTSQHYLKGGCYQVTTTGAVALQQLGPDASTWLTVATAAAAGVLTPEYLAAGEYRFTAGASAIYAEVAGVPI